MMYYESTDGQFLFTDELRKAMGQRLRKLRVGRGISLAEATDVIGFSKDLLGKIERGLSKIEAAQLFGLAELYEAPLSYILYGTSFDFPELAGEDHLDEEDTAKILVLEELSFDLGLLSDEDLSDVRRYINEKLKIK